MKNDEINKRYSISTFAKACNTTKDTLYHYENQKILVPVIDESNHYRYYSTNDFHKFQYIAHLRRMGFSLSEIRDSLNGRKVDTYINLLSLAQEKCQETIKSAERRYDITTTAKNAVTKYKNISLETPKVEFSENEYFHSAQFCGNFHSLEGIQQIGTHLNSIYFMPDTTSNLAVFKISNSSLLNGRPQRLAIMVQTLNPEKLDADSLHTKPAGIYLHMFFNLDLMSSTDDEREKCYRKMVDYANGHNYDITSDLYCYDHIGRFLTDEKKEFLCEFVVGIK